MGSDQLSVRNVIRYYWFAILFWPSYIGLNFAYGILFLPFDPHCSFATPAIEKVRYVLTGFGYSVPGCLVFAHYKARSEENAIDWREFGRTLYVALTTVALLLCGLTFQPSSCLDFD